MKDEINEEKFSLEAVERTFTNYKRGQMFDGVIVIKRDEGSIFNIGGKNDAFLPREEAENYQNLKIGDRFKVVILDKKNEDGMLVVSKNLADNQIIATQNASKLKLGSRVTFVVTEINNEGFISKMGEYFLFIPSEEMSKTIRDRHRAVGKQFEGIVTEIDRNKKEIFVSVRMLEEQIKENNEMLFWSSIFINKIVRGRVKKLLNYGAFVDVGGVDCFLHISNISHERINHPCVVIKEGEEYNFKVIDLDRENKKVGLSMKALEESPKTRAIRELVIGQEYVGQVVKILTFGAIIKLDNGASGLLHIKNATENGNKQIYEIVKLDQMVKVLLIDKNEESERISFKLIEVIK